MRIDKPEGILSPTNTPVLLPSPGQDDFLARVNSTISNFKELLKIVEQMKGLPLNSPSPLKEREPRGERASPGVEPKAGSGFAEFVQFVIASGYGDTPVKQLIKMIEPFTINQFVEKAKNVKLNR